MTNKDKKIKESQQDHYCISFIPIKDNTVNIFGISQIFLALTDSKVDELRELFEIVNNNPKTNIKLTIEEFIVGV